MTTLFTGVTTADHANCTQTGKTDSLHQISALEFGLAAKIGKNIRNVFHNVYEKYDGPMVRRLTAAIAACIRTSGKEVGERDLHDADLSQLRGFTFNKDALFEKLIAVGPILDVAPNGRIQF